MIRMRAFFVAMAAVSLCGCQTTPPIGKGLAGDDRAADVQFNERVKQRFPEGSQESALVAELQLEKFVIQPITTDTPRYSKTHVDWQFMARYPKGYEMPLTSATGCRHWDVFWRAEDGKIVAIHGRFSEGCIPFTMGMTPSDANIIPDR